MFILCIIIFNCYNFVRWRIFGQPVTFPFTIFEDRTFIAEWSPIVYNITYIMNGGTNNAANPNTYTIESPKIVLQRFDIIGALNNPVIKTPNLDRLAKSGVAFTNAYAASPVCIASRCATIYGQYPANNGCYENTVMPEDGRMLLMSARNISIPFRIKPGCLKISIHINST